MADEFMLPLSPTQVQMVARASTGTDGLLPMLLALAGDDTARLNRIVKSDRNSKELSFSLINALLVLAAASRHNGAGATQVAHEVALSANTAARYLRTWVKVGALVQNPQTHLYHLADALR
jgi:hypothetical protein